MEKILVLGGTGIMGAPLVDKAVQAGYQVDAVALDAPASNTDRLRYICTDDARNPLFLSEIMKGHYDVVVDFMTYSSVQFRRLAPMFLNNCGRYFFLSSCRVFADEQVPITESAPRLIDTTDNHELLLSDDYCMHKARGENYLRAGSRDNWTIVRPSTTYGHYTCQLLSLSLPLMLKAKEEGRTILLHEKAKDIPASLTCGEDVAEMIFRLLFLPQAQANDYNVTSSESHTWSEIASYFRDIFDLTTEWVDEEQYLRFRNPDYDPIKFKWMKWQMDYARLFRRVYDNSKLLEATGLKQKDFLPLYDGLLDIRNHIL